NYYVYPTAAAGGPMTIYLMFYSIQGAVRLPSHSFQVSRIPPACTAGYINATDSSGGSSVTCTWILDRSSVISPAIGTGGNITGSLLLSMTLLPGQPAYPLL